ncbi:Hypothetical protein D9617_49g041240 [Elsinoe fawcettii]|nr:Hypothetical protein D9617_49g041240 [Elsinoe fawcettii]
MPFVSSTVTSDAIPESSQFYNFTNSDDSDWSDMISSSTSRDADTDFGDSSLIWAGSLNTSSIIATYIITKRPEVQDVAHLDLLLARAKVALGQEQPGSFSVNALDDPEVQAVNERSCTAFEVLMRDIGKSMSRGHKETRQRIYDDITRIVQASVFDVDGVVHSTQGPQPDPEAESDELSNNQTAEVVPHTDMQGYTIALYEYAQNEGAAIHLDTKQISYGSPPEFRVQIHFMGAQYRGHGQSKKAAKHVAAKMACDALDIHQSV